MGLCARHEEASRRLREHFAVWEVRMGVDWEHYLKIVSGNGFSGKWIKEAAEYMISNGRKK